MLNRNYLFLFKLFYCLFIHFSCKYCTAYYILCMSHEAIPNIQYTVSTPHKVYFRNDFHHILNRCLSLMINFPAHPYFMHNWTSLVAFVRLCFFCKFGFLEGLSLELSCFIFYPWRTFSRTRTTSVLFLVYSIGKAITRLILCKQLEGDWLVGECCSSLSFSISTGVFGLREMSMFRKSVIFWQTSSSLSSQLSEIKQGTSLVLLHSFRNWRLSFRDIFTIE